jgi:probable HAF family extracellular repeat protein
MHDLGDLGGSESYAFGINNNGVVTGRASLSFTKYHAFRYDGTMHDLGTLGGTNSQGNAINDAGIIVGNSQIAGTNDLHAFLFDATMHDLGTLGGTYSSAESINSAGQVVGQSDLPGDSVNHAFLYTGTSGILDLNALIDPQSAWVLTDATGINDLGQIVGSGTIGGQTHAFLATPVPEPSGLAIATLGIVSLMLAPGLRRGGAAKVAF